MARPEQTAEISADELLGQQAAIRNSHLTAQRNTIIWDLDGTLVDSAADLTIALNKILNEENLWGLDIDQVRGMIGDGVGTLIKRGFRAAGREITPEVQAKLQARYLKHYIPNAATNTELYPLVKETLSRFKVAGFVQGICTNKPLAPTLEILQSLGISDYFSAIVGGDSTPVKKPSPTPLQECMEILGAHPENTFMIGDSAVDDAAAHSAGIPMVFISHGYCHIPHEELKATTKIDSYYELSTDQAQSLKF